MRMRHTLIILMLTLTVNIGLGQRQYRQFVESAQQYAAKDLSMFCFDLTQRYATATRESLSGYYAQFGKNWGDVVMALSMSEASNTSVGEILVEYDRTKPVDWNKIAAKLGIVNDKKTQQKLNTTIKQQLNSWKSQINGDE